jgi:hypothetical protein
MTSIPFPITRSAPDKPGIESCCKIEGNLEWSNHRREDGSVFNPNAYMGTCRICKRRHYVLVAKSPI